MIRVPVPAGSDQISAAEFAMLKAAIDARSRSMRRGGAYRVDYRAAGSSNWTTLASISAGQPRPIAWRVPLPADGAGGQLRSVGPCPSQTALSCVLDSAP